MTCCVFCLDKIMIVNARFCHLAHHRILGLSTPRRFGRSTHAAEGSAECRSLAPQLSLTSKSEIFYSYAYLPACCFVD